MEDSPRFKELIRASERDVRAVGMVGASTALEMVEYIRILEQRLSQSDQDTERLNFILRYVDEDYTHDIQDVLGDYNGDDESQYFDDARSAIDEAMKELWQII